jgi:hypothetical protein
MKRRLWWLVGLFAALGSVLAAAGSASAAINTGDDHDLSAIGVDLPGVTANQPASIGNFAGEVGFESLGVFAPGR